MTIVPHCPSRGVQTVKSRLLTDRTIPSLLALFLIKALGGAEVTPCHARYSIISDIRYKSISHAQLRAEWVVGKSDHRPDISEGSYETGLKLNYCHGLDVSSSDTENPIEHLEEEPRHARRRLGLNQVPSPPPTYPHRRQRSTHARRRLGLNLLTPTATDLPAPQTKEHAMRDVGWG
jgi:hypothetical protein